MTTELDRTATADDELGAPMRGAEAGAGAPRDEAYDADIAHAGIAHADIEDADIYAVLGVREDASPLLAREMYWARIQPLLDPARRDDPDARATIEELNRALAIISDAEQRADYDALSRPVAEPEGAPSAVLRWLWRATLLAGLASAVVILGVQSSWTTALLAGGTCLAFLVAGVLVTRPRRAASTVHERLGVQEDATKRDLDIAYQARAQQLLVRLGSDPRVVEALNDLDRDYLDAMRALMTPGSVEVDRRPAAWRALAGLRRAVPSRPPSTSRPESTAGPAEVFDPIDRIMVDREPSAAPPARRPAARDDVPVGLSEAPDAAGSTEVETETQPGTSDVPSTHETTSTPAPSPAARPERRWGLGRRSDSPTSPAIDLEQRLAASLKASALEIATQPPAPGAPEVASAPPSPAYLCLFASVGVRKVPIAERPLRIGSASDCDLVLPERQGVAAEHALVWRRGDAVVLHVTDPNGECAVNGRASTWATLEHGDELRVGDVELKIEIEAA